MSDYVGKALVSGTAILSTVHAVSLALGYRVCEFAFANLAILDILLNICAFRSWNRMGLLRHLANFFSKPTLQDYTPAPDEHSKRSSYGFDHASPESSRTTSRRPLLFEILQYVVQWNDGGVSQWINEEIIAQDVQRSA